MSATANESVQNLPCPDCEERGHPQTIEVRWPTAALHAHGLYAGTCECGFICTYYPADEASFPLRPSLGVILRGGYKAGRNGYGNPLSVDPLGEREEGQPVFPYPGNELLNAIWECGRMCGEAERIGKDYARVTIPVAIVSAPMLADLIELAYNEAGVVPRVEITTSAYTLDALQVQVQAFRSALHAPQSVLTPGEA